MRSQLFFKTDPFNFTPQSRTPWAGDAIANIKKRYGHKNIPNKIGESWEVSTTRDFPSAVAGGNQTKPLLSMLETAPSEILGQKTAQRFGAHCPVLLKWIESSSPLSIQIHPSHNHPSLKHNECGKPEAWLVVATQPGACIYVGFKKGLSRAEVERFLAADNAAACLNRIEPKPFEFFSIPPGCVHALGAGVFILEPQMVLPQKTGVTWRLSDWQRRYNANGVEDSTGQPRELHSALALSAIDWNLPQGCDLESTLAQKMKPGARFAGSPHNPFGAQIYNQEGAFLRQPLFTDEFELVTVWGGKASLQCSQSGETCELVGGESALVSARVSQMKITTKSANGDKPGVAFFSLNPESSAWHS